MFTMEFIKHMHKVAAFIDGRPHLRDKETLPSLQPDSENKIKKYMEE